MENLAMVQSSMILLVVELVSEAVFKSQVKKELEKVGKNAAAELILSTY